MKAKIRKLREKFPENAVTVYGKNPRKSQSSQKYSYLDLDLFLYWAKANTSRNVHIYHNRVPYPLIKVIQTQSLFELGTTYAWIAKNYDEILKRLKKVDSMIHLPTDVVNSILNDK